MLQEVDASGTVGSGCPVYGCTDPAANNYDASADTDDGSCTYCTDNVVLYTAGAYAYENTLQSLIVMEMF